MAFNFLEEEKVSKLTGIGVNILRKLSEQAKFPKKHKIGSVKPIKFYYIEQEVNAWLTSQKKKSVN